MSLTRMTTTPKCRKTSQAQGPRSTVHGPNPEGADSRPKKFKIGPYTVVDTVDHVLGGGSYGKVFCSTGKDGRKAVVKLFRKRDAMDDAKHEADMYRRISPLASAYQRWFPRCWMPTCMELTGPPFVPYPCGLSLVRWPGVPGGSEGCGAAGSSSKHTAPSWTA